MAETPLPDGRPLSPHLQIYRWRATMVMSILHRLTGAALYLGMILVAAWLVAAVSGSRAFAAMSAGCSQNDASSSRVNANSGGAQRGSSRSLALRIASSA